MFLFFSKQVSFDYSDRIEFLDDPRQATVDILKNICEVIDNYKLRFENLTLVVVQITRTLTLENSTRCSNY
jgi:hypothetical protein